jgi:hypothetical protein
MYFLSFAAGDGNDIFSRAQKRGAVSPLRVDISIEYDE